MGELDRRRFLSLSAGGAVALGWRPAAPGAAIWREGRGAQEGTDARPRRRLRKAVGLGMVQVQGTLLDRFLLLRDLGFDGVELDSPSDRDLDETVAALAKSGLGVSAVVDSVHWSQPLSSGDPEVRRRGREALVTALEEARALRATSVLLVPAVVNAQTSYDDAWERSTAEIRAVLPRAAELGVTIAIENVWNHFLQSPLEAARYVDQFESPHVAFHFDIGNVVHIGWPEQWIRILGPRIVKLHVKEYSRKKRDELGLWKGFEVELGEGDVSWPDVMRALDEVGYAGWATAEVAGGKRDRLAEIAERMNRVLAS